MARPFGPRKKIGPSLMRARWVVGSRPRFSFAPAIGPVSLEIRFDVNCSFPAMARPSVRNIGPVPSAGA